MQTLAGLVLISCLSQMACLADVLVPAGTVWKYLDTGTDQGTAWRQTAYNDAAWANGPAQLGYGDGDEATVVSYGPNASNKYITTYFRHAFTVADPEAYSGLRLQVLRDDGVVVYLNGIEVFRDNLPAGNVTFTTLASTAIAGSGESTFVEAGVDASALVAGANVLAVEVHQSGGSSSDLGFDLQLHGNTGLGSILRGPYLQIGTPTSVTLRWRTDSASDALVRYGPVAGNLNLQASSPSVTTEHIVRLTGLQPDTRYDYELGNSIGWFSGDANDFFVTAPVAGTPKSTRVWVVGDSGTADANAAAVRNAYLTWAASRPADLWLMLGDNAYTSGTDAEFQAAVFNMYPSILQNTVLWPTRGNHESDLGGTGSTYYNIFSLPTGGEAGGIASGTEAYYAFDYGNAHFICLDSQGTSRSPTGAMATWLQNDLLATAQAWIIAFWHHPPYSKGSHNSDTEFQLVEMRTNILPILEAGGVDLVLCGHSHSYERSFLLDGHYGASPTLVQSMKVDGGDGREDGTGAYTKPSGDVARAGAVYTVAGSSGQISGGTLNHPAMFISLNELGSVILDINGNRLDAAFLRSNGTVGDYFTVIKGGAVPAPPAAPSGLAATAVSSTQIDLAWTDNANNESGFRIERSTDGVNFTELAIVGANVVNGADPGLTPNTTYSYRVSAFNDGGSSDLSNVASATTPLPPPVTLTLTSVAAADGYVLESNETSGVGRSVNATTTGTSGLRAGDDGQDRQYKSVVSFDTSSLPDDATVLSATLRLRRGTVSGTTPFQTHGLCRVDLKSGTGFNGSTTLVRQDFEAPADAAGVATLSAAAANGQWSEGAINPADLGLVNRTGTTQFRVYFETDDNDDLGNDYIGWYAGDNKTAANRPQLVITYR